MSAPQNNKIEKYSMDKRVLSILKRSPKRGIWMKDLAIKLGISRSLLNYYLFGMKKKDKRIGGRLKNEISIRKEGNNRFICLNKKQK